MADPGTWLRPGDPLGAPRRQGPEQSVAALAEQLLGDGDEACAAGALEARFAEVTWVVCLLASVGLGAAAGLLPAALAEPAGWLAGPTGRSTGRGWDALRRWRELLAGQGRDAARRLGQTPPAWSLLDPAATPLLDRHPPRDEILLAALTLLLAAPAAPRAPVAAADWPGRLRQLLLDLQPCRASEQLTVLQQGGRLLARPTRHAAPQEGRQRGQLAAGQIYLQRWRGRRKGSGAYYTPPTMIRFLVREALAGRLERSAPELLALRLIDPAAGDGAFLVEALRQLTQAGSARLPTGRAATAWRAELAHQCLHGVELDPLALALAQAGLWLAVGQTALAAPELLPGLRLGDSLLGRGPRAEAGAPARRPARGSRPTAAGAPEGMGPGAPLPALDWPAAFPQVFGDRPDARRGFDAVLGNPPWEIVKARAPDLAGLLAAVDPGAAPTAGAGPGQPARLALAADPALAARWAEFRRGRLDQATSLAASDRYRSQSQGDRATAKLFLELACDLLAPGGTLALVLPGGLAIDRGAAELRRRLLEELRLRRLYLLRNRGHFPIHRSWRIALIVADRQPPDPGAPFSYTSDIVELAQLDADAGPSPALSLTPADLRRLSPTDLAFPELGDLQALELLRRLEQDRPRLGEAGPGWPGVRFCRELDMTEDADLFASSPGPGRVALWEGKRIHQFRLDHAPARLWVDRHQAAARVRPAGNLDQPRLAYRAVARATDAWTGIAALLPAGAPAGNSLHVLRSHGLPLSTQLYLLGLLNSFVVNYLLRRRIQANLSLGHVARLPIVPPGAGPSQQAELVVRLAERLGGADAPGLTPAETLDCRAELEATVAARYGLGREDFARLLADFPRADPALCAAALARLEPRQPTVDAPRGRS